MDSDDAQSHPTTPETLRSQKDKSSEGLSQAVFQAGHRTLRTDNTFEEEGRNAFIPNTSNAISRCVAAFAGLRIGPGETFERDRADRGH